MGKTKVEEPEAYSLNYAVLSPDDSITVETWAAQHKIELVMAGTGQYKILNGCIPNIMLYPRRMKLMFQTKGRNYVIDCTDDKNLVALIKGDLSFRRNDD